jgi:phage tail sheath protein FI
MAETLLSPGVLARENDQSFLTAQPVQAGAAILGPTVKGPTVPTVVTTYSQYQNKFGTLVQSGSDFYTYFTSIAAYNYFQNGGDSLLVGRITNGTYTSATSSLVTTGSGGPTTGLSPFILETLSKGTIMNTGTTELTGGALATGSSDNIRWEVVSPNSASGTFSLLIRKGDDTANSKVVLETWTNLSLDPKATNYIARVIGDQTQNIATDGSTFYIQTSGSYTNASAYVRVRAVNYQTPNYFDNTGTAKNQFTGSIPSACSGTFNGAAGTPFATGRQGQFYENAGLTANADSQGVTGSDYTVMLNLLANADEYQYNVISMPGLNRVSAASQITTLISNAQNRGDNIAVVDMVPYGTALTTVTSQALAMDTSYGATYWPWVQTFDPDLGNAEWVPASTLIPAVYAFNDNSSEAWFAPAGFNRGGLSTVVRAERKLTQGDRDSLYQGNVNPIATFPNQGVVVFGQKTLQKKASALDRVNVRRLLITLKGYISQIADNLVFEQNTIATRNSFLAQVNPYLASVQQRQGLYAFKVVMDDSNNTADVIDRNELIGQIYLQPTKTAEYIYLDFNLTPTGATFPG